MLVQCIMNAVVAIGCEGVERLFSSSSTSAVAIKGSSEPVSSSTRSKKTLRVSEDIAAGGELSNGNAANASSSDSFLSKLGTFDVMRASFAYVFAMYTSNEALQYVSYPMQALAKSCKLIPVLIGSIILLKKKYRLAKYICVLLMTIGITMFQMGKSSTKGGHGKDTGSISQNPYAEYFGLGLLLLSLILDGVTGPFQERLTHKHNLKNTRQMLVNNTWATVYMFIMCVINGELSTGYQFFNQFPSMIQPLILFGLCSGFGQIFIFYTIRTFDSLTLSTITTTRKFFTILVSVLDPRNGHKLSKPQWAAVLVVFAGVGLEVYDGDLEKRQKKAKELEESGKKM